MTGNIRDYNYECGYPDNPTVQQYKEFYDRWGIATRAVQVWPKECWQVTPIIYEDKTENVTEFEKAVLDLAKRVKLFSFLSRIDILSGIGHYGLLLFGLDDGLKLRQPVRNGKRDLLYLRTFDESVLEISTTELDTSSSRYGNPILYSAKTETSQGQSKTDLPIHYSRVLHVADNCESSEVLGTPRLRAIFNNIHDVRKVGGGAGEMFWKGGFPGLGITVDPTMDLDNVTLDTDTMKDEIEKYSDSLQRYMILTGAKANTLAPNVADPRGTFEVILKQITIALGVPMRVFIGTEAAKLASAQDKRTWQGRVKHRQEDYVTPFIIRPTIDRLIEYGVLPEPKQYGVEWPDIEQPSEGDQVKIANERSKAIATYFSSGAYKVIAPQQYFKYVHGYGQEQIDAIMQGAKEFKDTFDDPSDGDNMNSKQRFEKKRNRLADAKEEP